MQKLNNITFRKSTTKDTKNMIELLNKCFGAYPWKFKNALDDLNGRYLLAFNEDKLVAMSGITTKSIYTSYEIDWTCTDPNFQGKGIMTELLTRLINNLPKDEKPVYCSCWRFGWEEKVNMFKVMERIGAVEVVHNENSVLAPIRMECTECAYAREKECTCYTDLYKLERH